MKLINFFFFLLVFSLWNDIKLKDLCIKLELQYVQLNDMKNFSCDIMNVNF